MEKTSLKISPQENEFLADILAQPAALRRGLAGLDLARLEPFVQMLGSGKLRRVVLTGMGSSLAALYPAWLHLVAAGIDALWVDTAELLHSIPQVLSEDTLLWAASQSGRSAEIVALMEQLDEQTGGEPLGALIAFTNEIESPLANGAQQYEGKHLPGLLLPLNAGPEFSVSTRTYLNTLGMAQVVSRALSAAGDAARPRQVLSEIAQFAAHLETYLAGWALRLDELVDAVGHPTGQLALLGRGSSMSAVYEGALSIMEAAKFPVLAMEAAQFRHGPLEVAAPGFTALVFAGEGPARELNRRLYNDLRQKGAHALWLEVPPAEGPAAQEAPPGAVRMPAANGAARPLAEILPAQLLCLHLALEQGYVPGTYRWVGKVTGEE